MADVATTLQRVRDLGSAGAHAEAQALLSKLFPRHRDNPNVNAAMCRLLTVQQKYEEAIPYARRAVRAAPDDPNMLTNLANLLSASTDSDEALPIYQKVIRLDPSRRAVRSAYCALLIKRHRVWEAAEAAREGLERVPDDREFLSVLALAVRAAGRSDRAVEILRESVAKHPGELQPAIVLANTMNYIDVPPDETFRVHRAIEAAAPGVPSPPEAVALEGRRLRVGILSADLRGHSVAYFTEPILREFDRERFEMVCFSDAHIEDGVSERLRGFATEWHRTSRTRDEELDALVRAQKIDVILDLAGLSRGNRYEVLKLKPAPVQITYCGYPNTTGLSTVDYRIVDARTDPAGYEERCSEKLLRIDPCFLCFSAVKGAPDLVDPPCARDASAGVTFGSFNALFKLSDRTVALWARVLGAVPGSRLALKGASLTEQPVQDDVQSRFVGAGIEPSRIGFVPYVTGPADPLRAYDQIDIGLDPAPYNGTTTTIEAVLMGVPVVSLEGATHAGRVGYSLLSTLGHSELIARTDDDYVRIAAGLASDRGALKGLRRRLRDDLLGSALCDARAFTRKFERALLHAWHEKTGL